MVRRRGFWRTQSASAGRQGLDRAAYLMEKRLSETRRTRQACLFLTWVRSLPEQTVPPAPFRIMFRLVVPVCVNSTWSGPRDDAEAGVAAEPVTRHRTTWADTEDLPDCLREHLCLSRIPGASPRRCGRTVLSCSARPRVGRPEDHFIRCRGRIPRLAAWPLARWWPHGPHSPRRVHSCTQQGTSWMSWTDGDARLPVAGFGQPSRARLLCEQAFRRPLRAVTRTFAQQRHFTSRWPSSTQRLMTSPAPRCIGTARSCGGGCRSPRIAIGGSSRLQGAAAAW